MDAPVAIPLPAGPASPVAVGPVDTEPLMRAAVRRGATVVAAWAVLMAAWLVLAPISGGVQAQGQVKVDANRLTVTHRDGGTVARVAMREGQRVRRGDLLVVLEDVRVDASADQWRASLAADRLRQSRLEAEVALAARWTPSAALGREFASVARFGELAAKERTSFETRRASLVTQLDAQARQARDTEAEITVRERERVNSQHALDLMRDELQANKTLEQQNFVNRTRVLSLERGVSEYESRRLANEAELAQARQRLTAIEAHDRSLRDAYVQAASDELRDVGARLAENEQKLRSSADDQDRQKVVAPVDGVLMNLRVNTVGSALGPRDPVVDIVPAGAPLYIEARLPLDAGPEVHAGTPAEVRLLSGNHRYEKLLAARVRQVSADALSDDRNGAPYFTALVEVTDPAASSGPEVLRPGMGAEVYIRTSERTAIDFLTEPLAGFFRRGFRER